MRLTHDPLEHSSYVTTIVDSNISTK